MRAEPAGESRPLPEPQGRRATLRERIVDGELGGFVLLAPAVSILLLLTVWPLCSIPSASA